MQGSDPANSVHQRSRDLFALCEAWLSGLIPSDSFTRQFEAALRGDDSSVRSQAAKPLEKDFNHAVRCGLAVQQAIEDLEAQAIGRDTPIALRAYYFGKSLPSEAPTLAMMRCLSR